MNFEGEKMIEGVARKKYEEYVEAGLKMFPPFKGFGMMFVQFAIDVLAELVEKYGDKVLDTIADNDEVVYIGTDLPDEYTHSEYTNILKGANAKAKANAAQGLPELNEIASGVHYTPNTKPKHNKDAKHGWYRYESRFSLPVFGDNGEVTRYNVFHVAMILRHAEDGKKYLYDIMNIKKETSSLFQP